MIFPLNGNTIISIVILSNIVMSTISFKTDDEFKRKLEAVAERKGINVSAYIKMCLTGTIRQDLSEVTENGMTVAQELEILRSDAEDATYGPFETVEEMWKALDALKKAA